MKKIKTCQKCDTKLYTKEEKKDNLCSLCKASKLVIPWKEQLDVWRL